MEQMPGFGDTPAVQLCAYSEQGLQGSQRVAVGRAPAQCSHHIKFFFMLAIQHFLRVWSMTLDDALDYEMHVNF